MPEIIVINARSKQLENRLLVAAYCRVSTESSDQRNSFSAQVREYTSQINAKPEWALAGVFADEGITGTSTRKRTEFQRMIEDCRQGKIQRILVKSVSRFARNTQECLEYIRELKALGVSVFFEKENLDTGALSSEMMLAMLSGMAQEESASISQNVRWSLERRMKNGDFNTCFAPFGYKLINGQLEICDEEAKIVSWIFDSYVNGMSRTDIAKSLTERGIRTKGKKSVWTKRSIDYILENERYMGDAVLQKRYTVDSLAHKDKRNKGEMPMYYVQNINPAIIDRALFEKAAQLKTLRKPDREMVICESVLRKKIVCAECGSVFRRRSSNRGNTRWSCYKHDSDRNSCPVMPVAETDVKNAFLALFYILKSNYGTILKPMLMQLQKLQNGLLIGSEDIYLLNQEISKIMDQLHAINRLKTKGFMEPDVAMEKTNELNTMLMEVQKRRSRLMGNHPYNNAIQQTEELIDIIQNAPNDLASLDDSEVFSMMVDKVRIDQHKNITFRLINGLELCNGKGGTDG